MALKKFCARSGCKAICDAGQRYCIDHTFKANSQRNKEYDQSVRYKRDKQLAEFYHSDEWEATRLEVLRRDHYLCQECLRQESITPADMVHHKKPIRAYWHLRLEMDYLESLCNSCHGKVDHSTQG